MGFPHSMQNLEPSEADEAEAAEAPIRTGTEVGAWEGIAPGAVIDGLRAFDRTCATAAPAPRPMPMPAAPLVLAAERSSDSAAAYSV